MSLNGKVVIITGAAQGLGKAIAIGLAESGARVAITDVKQDGLYDTEKKIADACGADSLLAKVADVRQEADINEFVNGAMEKFGAIDGVINNAGLGPAAVREDVFSRPLPVWEYEPDQWRLIWDVNALGPFLLCRAVIPHMSERKRGRIINIFTTFQTMMAPNFGSYGPSKAALETMSATLVHELDGTGVMVNGVVPGRPADTAQVPDDIGIPRDRLLPPEVMVAPIRWLLTDEADEVCGRRVSANLWDDSLPGKEALNKARRDLAWPELIDPFSMADL